MTELMQALVNAVLMVSLAALCLLSLNLLWIFSLHLRHRRLGLAAEAVRLAAPCPPEDALPTVVVQLPTFNERHVVRRAVEASARLDWPRDRLHIQLIDDSTDDTTEIGQHAIDELRRQGFHAALLHRTNRTGYKAGALQAALGQTDCEYVAIFDADFIPPPDVLRRSIPPMMEDSRIAFCQARWEHTNADQNLLTRAQAIMLDAHFTVEQTARCWAGLPLPFNGTCGVWRRLAIDDAGGWQADTLTEDLDLSYRAHLRGWRGKFLFGTHVPGELPDNVPAWRVQQFRWNKGFAQVARKLLPTIWRAALPLHHKMLATCHLLQCTFYPLAAVALVCTLLTLFTNAFQPVSVVAAGIAAAALGVGSSLAVTLTGQVQLGKARTLNYAAGFLAVVALNSGLALSNGRGVLEGFGGKISAFVRTPKKGAAAKAGYRAGGPTGLPELALGLFALAALSLRPAWFSPFLGVSIIGYLTIGWLSLHSRLSDPLPAPLRWASLAERQDDAPKASDQRTGDLPG